MQGFFTLLLLGRISLMAKCNSPQRSLASLVSSCTCYCSILRYVCSSFFVDRFTCRLRADLAFARRIATSLRHVSHGTDLRHKHDLHLGFRKSSTCPNQCALCTVGLCTDVLAVISLYSTLFSIVRSRSIIGGEPPECTLAIGLQSEWLSGLLVGRRE